MEALSAVVSLASALQKKYHAQKKASALFTDVADVCGAMKVLLRKVGDDAAFRRERDGLVMAVGRTDGVLRQIQQDGIGLFGSDKKLEQLETCVSELTAKRDQLDAAIGAATHKMLKSAVAARHGAPADPPTARLPPAALLPPAAAPAALPDVPPMADPIARDVFKAARVFDGPGSDANVRGEAMVESIIHQHPAHAFAAAVLHAMLMSSLPYGNPTRCWKVLPPVFLGADIHALKATFLSALSQPGCPTIIRYAYAEVLRLSNDFDGARQAISDLSGGLAVLVRGLTSADYLLWESAVRVESAAGVFFVPPYYNHSDPLYGRWTRKAAEMGDIEANLQLAIMYDRGNGGVVQDQTRCAEIVKSLAERHDYPGGNSLYGRKCLYGRGVPQDPLKGITLIRRAVAQGYEPAKNRLANDEKYYADLMAKKKSATK